MILFEKGAVRMPYQAIFKRNEIKFLLTRAQKARILDAISPHMVLDAYGRTTIRNIYFDTDTYLLARRSMEHPVYKEKLRIRSYARAEEETPVFVELKKKYDSVVYKRRMSMPEAEAMRFFSGEEYHLPPSQIASEIDYFRRHYRTLHPVMFISYEREAYASLNGDDFRLTFDDTLLARRDALSLESNAYGLPLLGEDQVLMELKTPGGIPLWMTHALTSEKLYKTSFSKYGAAYLKLIYPAC